MHAAASLPSNRRRLIRMPHRASHRPTRARCAASTPRSASPRRCGGRIGRSKRAKACSARVRALQKRFSHLTGLHAGFADAVALHEALEALQVGRGAVGHLADQRARCAAARLAAPLGRSAPGCVASAGALFLNRLLLLLHDRGLAALLAAIPAASAGDEGGGGVLYFCALHEAHTRGTGARRRARGGHTARDSAAEGESTVGGAARGRDQQLPSAIRVRYDYHRSLAALYSFGRRVARAVHGAAARRRHRVPIRRAIVVRFRAAPSER